MAVQLNESYKNLKQAIDITSEMIGNELESIMHGLKKAILEATPLMKQELFTKKTSFVERFGEKKSSHNTGMTI